MTRDVQTQLRITAWPQSPLALPRIERIPSRLERSQEVIFPDVAGWNLISPLEGEQVALTGETYLHLRQVDLDDLDSITQFVERFGPLGGREAEYEIRRSRNETLTRSYGTLNFRREHARKERAFKAAILEGHPRAATLEEETLKHILSPPLTRIPSFVETLTEFRYAAVCLQDLTDSWLALQTSEDPSKLPWRSLVDRTIPTMNAPSAASFFSSTLDLFLQQFSPRLELAWHSSRPIGSDELEILFQPTDSIEVTAVRETRPAPLYAICALELFNHIVTEADYRVCANDRCRRIFVKQEGRSDKGQHRSRGVIYCDARCARAKAQRDYRRRKQASPPESRAVEASRATLR